MKTISAARFKEKCLALLDGLEPDGLVVTKRGKPIAKVIPYRPSPADLIGCLRGKIRVAGEILSTGERWDAHAEP